MNLRLDKVDNSPYHNDNCNFRVDVCPFTEAKIIVDIWHTVIPMKDVLNGIVMKEIQALLCINLGAPTQFHWWRKYIAKNSVRSQLTKTVTKLRQQTWERQGFWKFNSNLHDPVYVDEIINVICETDQNHEGLADKQMLWGTIKLEIHTQTIPYCFMEKRQIKYRNGTWIIKTLERKSKNPAWQEFNPVKLQ